MTQNGRNRANALKWIISKLPTVQLRCTVIIPHIQLTACFVILPRGIVAYVVCYATIHFLLHLRAPPDWISKCNFLSLHSLQFFAPPSNQSLCAQWYIRIESYYFEGLHLWVVQRRKGPFADCCRFFIQLLLHLPFSRSDDNLLLPCYPFTQLVFRGCYSQ